MPKRKTLEEVKQEIYELSDGRVEILSDEYINCTTPLSVRCECGNVFERSLDTLKQGFLLCKMCSAEKKAKLSRYSFEYVEQYINEESHGSVKLLSTEYINNREPLLLECKCGNIISRNLHDIKVMGPYCNKCRGNKHSNYTLDDAIKIISEAGCEYISGDFKNGQSKLLIKCHCGNTFERSLSKILLGITLCDTCANIKRANNIRHSMTEIIDYINSTGCEYISGEYENEDSLLTIKCRCGNIFQKSYKIFHRPDGDRCQECGRKIGIIKRRKYNAEDAKHILESQGFTMIGDYINTTTRVKCICENGHENNLLLYKLIYKEKCYCLQCRAENYYGENTPGYKGGMTKISKCIREKLTDWKNKIRNIYEKCPITGRSGYKTVVHHLLSFNNILISAINQLHINIKSTDEINNFESTEQFKNLLNIVLSMHTEDIGILISEDIHNQYHKEYGYGDNTPQQFNQFLIDHYSTTLEEIQSKHLLSKTA